MTARMLVPLRNRPSLVTREQLEQHYLVHGLAARHEAGHAVVASVLGLDVDEVTVGDLGHGYTGVTFDDDDHKAALVYLAGTRAERSHPEWRIEFEDIWQGSDDAREVQARCQGLSRSDVEQLRELLIEQVDDILHQHRVALDRVHQALLTEGRLRWKRLARLLDPKGADGALERSQGDPSGAHMAELLAWRLR
jgi:hypothetical protein